MSEPKEIAVEEMDGWLTSAYNGLNYSSIENADIRRAIRKRIEQPAVTVTQGQLNKWVDKIWDKCRREGSFGDEDLISMLTEIGVRVEP